MIFNKHLKPHPGWVDALSNGIKDTTVAIENLENERKQLKYMLDLLKACPDCDATGMVKDKVCKSCEGKGASI